MSDSLYSAFERSRETVWAHKEDRKAIDALRRKLDAETDMAANVAKLQDKLPHA
jgi:hypothetical protein